jgi:outer membrane assembly lipoprotein YfiO
MSRALSTTRVPRLRLAAVLVCAALVLLLAAPAAGQDRFRLTDEGWQQTATYPPDSPEGELQAIRRVLADGRSKDAEKQLDGWIARYPNHPMIVDAYLLRGDAKAARGRLYRALFDYEYVIRMFPATEQFHVALEREFEIARLFTQGVKRHFLGMRILSAKGEGAELLIRVQERAPGTPLGERAMITLADFYFAEANMPLAADAYDLFLQNYPRSEQREWAMLRLIQANLARFRGPAYDATGLLEAGQRLRDYRAEFPASAERLGTEALLVRIDESLAGKDLTTARWYEVRDRPVSAAYVYARVARDFPQTAAARVALQRLGDLDVDVTQLPGFAPAPGDAPASPLGSPSP